MNADEASISIWISVLYRYRKGYIRKKLEASASAGSHHLVLLALSRHDGSSQEQLAELLRVDKATIARAVKKLESDGYVSRIPNEGDKRAYRVFLTPKGIGILPEIKGAIREWDALIVRNIPEEARRTVEEMLRQMAHNACGVNKESAAAEARKPEKPEKERTEL